MRAYEGTDRAGYRALPGPRAFAEVDGNRPIEAIAAGIVSASSGCANSAAGRRFVRKRTSCKFAGIGSARSGN